MMRAHFDEELADLDRELILTGARCEEAIAAAAKALLTGDTELAKKVPPIRADIDARERSAEESCLRLLLRQQPVARDLRHISAALKMVTDMERIGDQADEIASIVVFLGGRSAGDFGHLGDMARESIGMVTDSVDAWVRRDTDMAKAVAARDDTVDALFVRVRGELIDMIRRQPEDGGFAIDLLMTAKYFERIADHAVNIAGWAEFSVTGGRDGEAAK
jgi:phosphate transport system protein